MQKKVLGIAVILLCTILCGSVFAEDLKIGVMNFRKAFLEYEKTKGFQKELETKDEAAKKEFDVKAKEVRKLRDEIELLSEKAKEKKREELLKRTNELNAFRRNKGEELLRWRDTEMREINDNIVNTVNKYAQKNGYDVIFDKMSFVYSSDKYEITEKIITELNK